MKDFIKYTLASILGFMIAGVLLIFLTITGIAGMVASASADAPVTVTDNMVYRLEIPGSVVERGVVNPFSQFMGGAPESVGLDEIMASLEAAAENDHIKGVYFRPSMFSSCGAATRTAIRRGLENFKKSGKFIVAYADFYSTGMYDLATVADKILLNPVGHVSWHGMSANLAFYPDLMKKFGVKMQIFKVGTYKSAVEPYMLTGMSKASREQTGVFLDDIWNGVCREVAASRDLSVDSLNMLADRFMDLQSPRLALEQGMVDELVYEDEADDYVRELCGLEKGEKLRVLSMKDVNNLKTAPKKMPHMGSDEIAVYFASGEIDAPTAMVSGGGIDSKCVARDLRKLRDDKDVKAVVLRVNSPGGSAYGSEQMWNEVRKFRGVKPLIVSMGDYAASGGYYMSCWADSIVAEGNTLTGSIGIFGMFPDPTELLTKKLEIHYDGVKTNAMSDFGEMGRHMSAPEMAVMQQHIEQGYALFLKRVAEGRGMSVEDVAKIAEGRVWTGETALKIGLVDVIGGLERAVEIAAGKVGLIGEDGAEHFKTRFYPAKPGIFDNLMKTKDDYMALKLRGEFGACFRMVDMLMNIDKMDHVQARMPFVEIAE